MKPYISLLLPLLLSACVQYNNFKFAYDDEMRKDNYGWENSNDRQKCLSEGNAEVECKDRGRRYDDNLFNKQIDRCAIQLAEEHGYHFPRRKAWPMFEKCMNENGWKIASVLDI